MATKEQFQENSDFRKSKPGDQVFTIQYGYVKISEVDEERFFIDDDSGRQCESYGIDGKYHTEDIYPSAFKVKPDCFKVTVKKEVISYVLKRKDATHHCNNRDGLLKLQATYGGEIITMRGEYEEEE